MSTLKLNLGCGQIYKKGYINVDAIDESVADQVMSALNLEFDDNTFTHVDCTQVLEHLGAAKSIYSLAEVYRVLKPGGMFLIETPDLMSSFKTFLKGSEDQRKQVMNWIYGLDMPGMSHKYGFPEELLERMLLETGFTDVEISKVDTNSIFPSLRATSKKPDSGTHQFFSQFRKRLVQTDVIDLDNQVDAIEKEAILHDLLHTALTSKNSGQHLNGTLSAASTSCPKIGQVYLELAISKNLVPDKEASRYLRVFKELVSLDIPRVMTHLFQEIPITPGFQAETIKTIKSMFNQSVRKLLGGDQSVIEEIRKTSEKIDGEIQTDLFTHTFLEMTSASHLALGAKEFSQGQLNRAVTHYDKARRFNRDSILAYWNLARLQTLKDTIEEARSSYNVTKELLKLHHPKIQRSLCKRIDDEIEYITKGSREQINKPVLSLHR